MAYLTEAERDELLNELVDMSFNQARRKLRRMDPQVRLGLYRNMQRVGEWATRYELKGLGTIVTLIERADNYDDDPGSRAWPKYDLIRVAIEPTPDNRT